MKLDDDLIEGKQVE